MTSGAPDGRPRRPARRRAPRARSRRRIRCGRGSSASSCSRLGSPQMQANRRQIGGSVILGVVMAVVYPVGERLEDPADDLPLVASSAGGRRGLRTSATRPTPTGVPCWWMVPALFVMIPGDFLCAAAAEISVRAVHGGHDPARAVGLLILFQLAAGVIIAAGGHRCGHRLPHLVVHRQQHPLDRDGVGLDPLHRRDGAHVLRPPPGRRPAAARRVRRLGVSSSWCGPSGTRRGRSPPPPLLTLMGVLLGREPRRPPNLVIILGGVFVLTVGSMALRGLTTLAGGPPDRELPRPGHVLPRGGVALPRAHRGHQRGRAAPAPGERRRRRGGGGRALTPPGAARSPGPPRPTGSGRRRRSAPGCGCSASGGSRGS